MTLHVVILATIHAFGIPMWQYKGECRRVLSASLFYSIYKPPVINLDILYNSPYKDYFSVLLASEQLSYVNVAQNGLINYIGSWLSMLIIVNWTCYNHKEGEYISTDKCAA